MQVSTQICYGQNLLNYSPLISNFTYTDEKVFVVDLDNDTPQDIITMGSAVYKARTLNYYLEPGAMYDDMKACNAVGVYKQGGTQTNSTPSLITKEEQELSHLKQSLENINLKQNEFVLYPNPTDGIVNIRYNTNENSRIELFDMAGRKIKVILFISGYTKSQISLEDIVTGVYSYKFYVGEKLNKSGKILKN